MIQLPEPTGANGHVKPILVLCFRTILLLQPAVHCRANTFTREQLLDPFVVGVLLDVYVVLLHQLVYLT